MPSHPSKQRAALTPAPASRAVEFSPAMIVAGIQFHLLDQGEALAVDDRSARAMLARLVRDGFTAFVPRVIWESISDRERLDWLLAVSHTEPALGPGRVATLRHRPR